MDGQPLKKIGVRQFLYPRTIEQLQYCTPTIKNDVYSLCALLIFMLTGIKPKIFIEATATATKEKLKSVGVNSELIDCIVKGLSVNPMQRPTIEQLQAAVIKEKNRSTI